MVSSLGNPYKTDELDNICRYPWRLRVGAQSFTAVRCKIKSGGQPVILDTPVACLPTGKEPRMNNIIYIVGLVVVVLAVLSFFGLR